jgi:hypothetical protein
MFYDDGAASKSEEEWVDDAASGVIIFTSLLYSGLCCYGIISGCRASLRKHHLPFGIHVDRAFQHPLSQIAAVHPPFPGKGTSVEDQEVK